MSKPKYVPLPEWKIQLLRARLNDPEYVDTAINKIADELTDFMTNPNDNAAFPLQHSR